MEFVTACTQGASNEKHAPHSCDILKRCTVEVKAIMFILPTGGVVRP